MSLWRLAALFFSAVLVISVFHAAEAINLNSRGSVEIDLSSGLSSALNSVSNIVQTEIRSSIREVYGRFVPVREDFILFNSSTRIGGEMNGGEGFWRGGPDLFYDQKRDKAYIYYRQRTPVERGRKAVILQTSNGKSFEKIWSINKEDLNALSIEGAALKKENRTYRLFISYQDIETGRWSIKLFEASQPSEFGVENSTLLQIETVHPHVKDPFIYRGQVYVNTASSFWTSSKTLELNPDGAATDEIKYGRELQPHPTSTSIIQIGNQSYVFYNWKPTIFHTGEEKSSIGKLKDGKIEPLLLSSKTLRSGHGTESLRYVKAEKVDEEIWTVYEKSLPNGQHGLYLSKTPAETFREKLEKLA